MNEKLVKFLVFLAVGLCILIMQIVFAFLPPIVNILVIIGIITLIVKWEDILEGIRSPLDKKNSRCQAYNTSTGKQCRNKAKKPRKYCSVHNNENNRIKGKIVVENGRLYSLERRGGKVCKVPL